MKIPSAAATESAMTRRAGLRFELTAAILPAARRHTRGVPQCLGRPCPAEPGGSDPDVSHGRVLHRHGVSGGRHGNRRRFFDPERGTAVSAAAGEAGRV